MSPRPLELFDLPTLHRYRNDVLPLDAERALTRGSALNAAGVLAHLAPTRKRYTLITEETPPLAGCLIQHEGESFARMAYLAPASALEGSASLPQLLEAFASQAGAWGARQILAELEESSPIFTVFRASGFSVYAWQRIWALSALDSPQRDPRWRKIHRAEEGAARMLHQQIVPPLLQPIEVLDDPPQGIVYEEETLQAYLRVQYGAQGIFLRPLIHPEMNAVPEKLLTLLALLREKRARPVYLCVRSYQAWLEIPLEDIGARPGPRQAVMVKPLTRSVRKMETSPTLPARAAIHVSQ